MSKKLRIYSALWLSNLNWSNKKWEYDKLDKVRKYVEFCFWLQCKNVEFSLK